MCKKKYVVFFCCKINYVLFIFMTKPDSVISNVF